MSVKLKTVTGGDDNLILDYDKSNRSTFGSSDGIFRAVTITTTVREVKLIASGYESDSNINISWISRGEQCD